ncbi:hypothetical protein MUK42_32955 [Musa troglodytarum]|uniref:Phosphomannomutase n=1 Tax=Musa troglodytarum TaxID=320322 RepID=A0A9E7HHZ8_9LILI|nr:hypothetical protein MUK42_32955 [Musa troglodytarum]
MLLQILAPNPTTVSGSALVPDRSEKSIGRMAARKPGVIALFDVDGTLTAPRKVFRFDFRDDEGNKTGYMTARTSTKARPHPGKTGSSTGPPSYIKQMLDQSLSCDARPTMLSASLHGSQLHQAAARPKPELRCLAIQSPSCDARQPMFSTSLHGSQLHQAAARPKPELRCSAIQRPSCEARPPMFSALLHGSQLHQAAAQPSPSCDVRPTMFSASLHGLQLHQAAARPKPELRCLATHV